MSASADRDGTPPVPAAPVPGSLTRSAAYAILGTAFFHLCQLGTLVLLAKFSTPEVQGQYFLALALALPIVLFFGLELRTAYVSDRQGEFDFSAYQALAGRMMGLAAVVLAIVLAGHAAAGRETSALLILLGIFAARICSSLSEVGWGMYQRHERLDLVARSIGLRGLALLVPTLVLVPLYWSRCRTGRLAHERLPEGAAMAMICFAIGAALVLIAVDRPRVRAMAGPARPRRPGDLLRLAWRVLPLGLVVLLINLCDSYPRWLFDPARLPNGAAQLGYFGSMAYITLAGNLLIIQLSTAAANRLATYYQTDRRRFTRLAVRLILTALVIGVGMLLLARFAGRTILRTLYTPGHAQYKPEFIIIVAANALALLTNVLGAATTQMRLFWVQVPVQLLTFAATATAGHMLILGESAVRGAAWTSVVRAVVQFVCYAGCMAVGLRARPGRPR